MKHLKGSALLVAAVCFATAPSAHAALYSYVGTGGAIADGSGSATSGAPLVSTVVVGPEAAGVITSVDIAFVGLSHSWVGDLTMVLTAPDGTSLDIMSRPGRGFGNTFGFSVDFVGANAYAFADSGVDLFTFTPPPQMPSGTYRPSTNPNPPATNALLYAYTPTSFLAAFGGLSAPGLWSLEIRDWSGGDTGTFQSWTLNVHTEGAPVPEPTTFALTAFGLVGLMAARRRRS